MTMQLYSIIQITKKLWCTYDNLFLSDTEAHATIQSAV